VPKSQAFALYVLSFLVNNHMKKTIKGPMPHPKTGVDSVLKFDLDNRIQNIHVCSKRVPFWFFDPKTADSHHRVPIPKEIDRCPVTNFVERSPHA
jgi:hypothetical protein